MDELSSLSTPIGSIRFPDRRAQAAEQAAMRAYGLLPAILGGIEEREVLRPAKSVPTTSYVVDTGPTEAWRMRTPDETNPVLGPIGQSTGAHGRPRLERYEQRIRPEEYDPEALAWAPHRAVPTMTEVEPEEARTFQRLPTILEAMERAGSVGGADEATRAALIKLIAGAHLPTERKLPGDVKEEAEIAATADALLQSGRAKTREEAMTFARAGTLGGARPSFETFMTPRPTPDQVRREQAAARDQAFRENELPKFNTGTAEGALAAMEAARQAGASGVVEDIRKQRGAFREAKTERTSERWLTGAAPAIEKRILGIRENQYATTEDVDSLLSRLDTAKADPSPRNLADLNAEIGRVSRSLVQRQQFAERMTRLDDKLARAREQAQKALQGQNLTKAEANVKFIIRNIDQEISRLTRDLYLMDAQTQATVSHTIDQLERRKEGFQQWLDDVTGSRAVERGRDIETRPDMTIPPTPRRNTTEGTEQTRDKFQDVLK